MLNPTLLGISASTIDDPSDSARIPDREYDGEGEQLLRLLDLEISAETAVG
jgi:hypothetical protein